MLSKVLCLLLFTSTLLQYGQAFWWQETTTKAPETVLKHIPLTYFRTYTYQPLAPAYPFFGAGGPAGFAPPPYAPQTPLLTGVRYDSYGNRYAPPQALVAQTAKTTTTTTTTTTPPPTTTPSTTTTTTTTTPAPTTTLYKEITPPLTGGPSAMNYGNEYPTFNRRFYTSAYNQQKYYRPSYPYPEYSTFNPAAMKISPLGRRSSSHIQFVPCMCPISVGLSAGGLDEKNGFDSFLGESRQSVDDDDDDMELPLEEDEVKLATERENKETNRAESSEIEGTQLLNKVDLERIEKLRSDDYHLTNSEKED